MIRVILPPNLRTLAHIEGEVALELNGTLTQRSLLNAVEAKYPMLRGTMRDHADVVRFAGPIVAVVLLFFVGLSWVSVIVLGALVVLYELGVRWLAEGGPDVAVPPAT